jgi:hypothetical protein
LLPPYVYEDHRHDEEGESARVATPKERAPRPFPCESGASQGSQWRLLVGPFASRRRDGGAKAMPSLWQYFVTQGLSQSRRSSPPKELDPAPWARFPAALQGFIALGKGTVIGRKSAIVVPSDLHAEREGHAPVVAVLLASPKGALGPRFRTAPRHPPKSSRASQSRRRGQGSRSSPLRSAHGNLIKT